MMGKASRDRKPGNRVLGEAEMWMRIDWEKTVLGDYDISALVPGIMSRE
jgi:hypothetical protein